MRKFIMKSMIHRNRRGWSVGTISVTRTGALFAVLFVLPLNFLDRASFAGTGSQVAGLDASVLVQPDLPVQIQGVSVRSDVVSRTTTLDYVASNRASEMITGLRFAVAVFNSRGDLVRGQFSCENVDVRPGEQVRGEIQLSRLLYMNPAGPGQRIVVGLEGGRTAGWLWMQAAPIAALLGAMKAGHVLAGAPVKSPLPVDNACADDYCDKCQTRADGGCGSRGISSYSCSVGTQSCSCSYTCNTVVPVEPPQN